MKSLHDRLEKQRAAARETTGTAAQRIAKLKTLRKQIGRWNNDNQIVDNKSLYDAAMKWANRLAASPTRAYSALKQVVREALDIGMAGANRGVVEHCSAPFDTQDLRNRVVTLWKEGSSKGSFLSKLSPSWSSFQATPSKSLGL